MQAETSAPFPCHAKTQGNLQRLNKPSQYVYISGAESHQEQKKKKKKNAHCSSLIPINVLQVTLRLEETVLFLGLNNSTQSDQHYQRGFFSTSYEADNSLPTPHSWKILEKNYNILYYSTAEQNNKLKPNHLNHILGFNNLGNLQQAFIWRSLHGITHYPHCLTTFTCLNVTLGNVNSPLRLKITCSPGSKQMDGRLAVGQ